MITLEEACEIYEKKGSTWPIDYITENETEWAFFEATNGFYDAYVIVINKETGNVKLDYFFKYEDLPEVPIPAKYVKEPPEQVIENSFEYLVSVLGGCGPD